MGAMEKMLQSLINSIDVNGVVTALEEKTGFSVEDIKQKIEDAMVTMMVIANDIETIKMQQKELIELKNLLLEMTRKGSQDE
jgi:hypothetical protein